MGSMEIRANILILVVVGLCWAGLRTSDPQATAEPRDPDTRELARLEDAFARNRGDRALARKLSGRYLERGRPGLAVAALRAADPGLLDAPGLAHRLAKAYEGQGRLLDALATAKVALARCARSLGTGGSSSATDVPDYGCDGSRYAALDMHRTALRYMVRWGVSDPQSRRARLAYELAARRARIASAD